MFGELTMSRGEKHKFWWTNIQFLGNVKVLLLMKYYKEKFIASFGEDLGATLFSSAKKSLQNMNESSTSLEKK